jgi:hypothetical protein
MTRSEAVALNVQYKLDVACLREKCVLQGPTDVAAGAVYELRTALWEVLRAAIRHKAVFVHPSHDRLVAAVVGGLPHLEHHTSSRGFSEALSLFVEDYTCLHLPLPGVLPGAVALTSAVLINCLARLHAGWGGAPAPAPALDALYYSCGLDIHPDLQTLCGSADELASLRQASLWNLTRIIADLVASLMLTRGPLSQEPKRKSKGKGQGQEQEQGVEASATEEFEHHRRCLLALVLGSEPVRVGVMRLLVPLLETADANVCRRATLATEEFFVLAVDAGRVDAVQVVASDALSACLRVVVADAPWSTGLEWSLLSLIELVYSRTVLGVSGDECATPPPSDKKQAKSSMTQWSGPGSASAAPTAAISAAVAAVASPLGSWSRDVLLRVPGVTREMVDHMECQLIVVNRKKRKDYIRDVVVAAKVAAAGDGVLGGAKAGAGGEGVLNIAAPVGGGYASARQQRRLREAKSGVAQEGGEEALSGLFSS